MLQNAYTAEDLSQSLLRKLRLSYDPSLTNAVAQHCINGDCLSQWRMPKFDPLYY